MATLSRFFFQKNKNEAETYVLDIVSLSNALEVGKLLQELSTASVVQVNFSADGGVLPDMKADRRVKFVEHSPQKEKVDFSAFQKAGTGMTILHYLAFYGRTLKHKRRCVTVPAPHVDWAAHINEYQARVESVLHMAWRDESFRVTKIRVISPNIKRKTITV